MIRSVLFTACLLLPPLPLTAQAREKVSIALDWTLNMNHVGLIAARDRGHYEAAGLEVEILPYSDTSSTALLAAGVVGFAYMTSLGFMSARASGADVLALWATMQRETGRLVYDGDNEATTRPADHSGKIYAGFGSAWEDALISTMIRADSGEPVYDTVTLGTGAYEALAVGRVDFTLEVRIWEGVNSEFLGRERSSLSYADYGVPDQQNGYVGTRAEVLAEDPEIVAAFMKATREGYAWAVDNPEETACLLLVAGEFPDPQLVRGSMAAILEGE